jgi:hypothetical protein
MIVRIMEEDQYRLDDHEAAEFEQLDHALLEAVSNDDQAAFQRMSASEIGRGSAG